LYLAMTFVTTMGQSEQVAYAPTDFSYPYGFQRRPLRAVCGLDYPGPQVRWLKTAVSAPNYGAEVPLGVHRHR
jgi:hypothetical protein